MENGLTKSMFLHEFDKFVYDISLGDLNVHWETAQQKVMFYNSLVVYPVLDLLNKFMALHIRTGTLWI